MMDDRQRSEYFGRIWPAACLAKRWRVKDEVRRRHTTGECMRLIGAPITESTTELDQNQITALFCYLDHLAHPSSLEKSQRWVDCQQDYKAYNLARQADWHERKAYGGRGQKLRRDRFKGATSAQGEPQEVFDPAAIRKRHMTMANRHKAKGYRPRSQPAGDLRFVAMVSGSMVVGATSAAVSSPAPAAPSGEELDENCPF